MSQANNHVPAVAHARSPRQEAQITELAVDSTRDGSGRNHRCSARAAVELDVSLGSDHNFYAGFVENLSAGGVFVATHLLRPVGEVIELSIYISDDEQVVTGTGEVRWLREYNEASDVPPGMGVKFLTLAEGADEIIQKFLVQRDPMFFDDEDDEMPEVVAAAKPEATTKVQEPEAAVSVKPEAAASVKPEAAASEKPEAAASEKPEAAASVQPEAAVSEKPEAAVSVKPEAAVSVKPEATVSEKPEAAASVQSEAAVSVKPEATVSEKPEAAVSVKPEATVSEKPEATASAKPEAAASVEPEATVSVKPEAASAATEPAKDSAS